MCAGDAVLPSGEATLLDRTARKLPHMTICDDAQRLLAGLRADTARPQSERGTRASEEDLQRAASCIEASGTSRRPSRGLRAW